MGQGLAFAAATGKVHKFGTLRERAGAAQSCRAPQSCRARQSLDHGAQTRHSRPVNWRVICFDLDGTLCDTREGILASLRHTRDVLSLPDPGGDYGRFIGPPLKDIFTEGFGLDEARALKAVDAYREFYVAGAMYQAPPFPGIPALLRACVQGGATLCVCTAKPWMYAEKILERFELLEFFSCVSGPELDGRRHTKPEIIAHALSEIGERPGPHVVMIGDRHYDIEGARALGIEAIAVQWGFGSDEELAATLPTATCANAENLALTLGI